MESEYRRQCQRMGCGNLINPRHRLQKFCSDACRQKDGREIRAAMRRDRAPALCDRCKAELKRKAALRN
jgi:hypothetical protein